jgi:ABC-type transport system substrate-binding protein
MLFRAKIRKLVSVGILLASSVSIAETLDIIGWPEPPVAKVNDGDHMRISRSPLFGRFACPSISRLNLMDKKNEPFLVSKIEVLNGGRIWKFTPKNDLVWWNGDNVSPADFKSFFETNLADFVNEAGLGKWTTPNFTVTNDSSTVTVSWQVEPKFGPYILNKISLSRKSPETKEMECVGSYKLTENAGKPQLERVAKAGRGVTKISLKNKGPKSKSEAEASHDLEFRFPYDFLASPWMRLPTDQITCERQLDLPVATMIVWNPQGAYSKNQAFRNAMTHLIPRGTILRSGAGDFGNLLSGPLLRAHPGYRRNLKVKDYDPKLAAKELATITDWKDKKVNDEHRAKILLFSYGSSNGFIEKVLTDASVNFGIELVFTDNPTDLPKVEGILTSAYLPWPDADFYGLLHSKAGFKFPYWALDDRSLDPLLEAYSLSLTQERPDFEALQKVHEVLYRTEPFSIIMQHYACLVMNGGKTTLAKTFIRDPDWLYNLLRGTL